MDDKKWIVWDRGCGELEIFGNKEDLDDWLNDGCYDNLENYEIYEAHHLIKRGIVLDIK